jgi:hypothetical protein
LAGRKDFFFEKRSKKLLRTGPSLSGKTEVKIDKSFLLLFFKKEVLPFFWRRKQWT